MRRMLLSGSFRSESGLRSPGDAHLALPCSSPSRASPFFWAALAHAIQTRQAQAIPAQSGMGSR